MSTYRISWLAMSVLVCGLAFATAPAWHMAHAAQTSPVSVQLEDLTWTELKARIAGGATTILIPIGGTEQSGPGIALGKHNARARALSQRIAAQLGNAIVAPL